MTDWRIVARLELENARLRAQLRAIGDKVGNVPNWPAIGAAWDESLLGRNHPATPQANSRSSSLGDACLRRLCYERIGAEKKSLDAKVCGIFHTGNELEESVKRSLSMLGYSFERSQEDVEYVDTDGTLLYRGHPDGILRHPLYPGRTWVADIKSMNGMIWNGIPSDPQECSAYLRTAADRPWLMKYLPQVDSYLMAYEQHGEKHDGGILIFVNKDNSRIKLATSVLTEQTRVWIVDRCRAVNRHCTEKTTPGFCANPKLCELCPYLDVTCEPAIVVKGISTVDVADPQNAMVIECLRGYSERKRAAKSFDDADKIIKARFKCRAPGEYLVEGIGTITVRPPNKRGTVTVVIRTTGENEEDSENEE